MKTYYKCGFCGETREKKDVILISETEYSGVVKDTLYLEPHFCGFLAIRCKEHPNADKNAKRAVYNHFRNLIKNHGYVWKP